MEAIISSLLTHFEKGSLTRRQLIQGIAMLAAGSAAGTGVASAAAAQAPAPQNNPFNVNRVDHVSIHAADLQHSIDFYQKVFGFTVVSQDKDRKIVRLGFTKTLVSLNADAPAGIVDHYALGTEKFDAPTVTAQLKAAGLTPLNDPIAGLHIKDPDGVNIQLF